MTVRRSRHLLAAVAALGLFLPRRPLLRRRRVSCDSRPRRRRRRRPTPTPPTGGGGVGSSSCPIGTGSTDTSCEKGSSRLQHAVLSALDSLVKEQPGIFDKTQEAGTGTGQYRVLDKEAYLNGLVANLTAAGFCAQRNPDDFNYEQVQAKNENGFSETFDVLSGAGYVRTGGIYKETCTPASFPVDRGELPPAGSGCGAPYPPEINRMNCKLHLLGNRGLHARLDGSRRQGLTYCSWGRFIDRATRPVRPEGSPERRPCEEWRVGHAGDTGRPGPPGPSTVSSAQARRAAATTTPRTSTRFSSTRPAPTGCARRTGPAARSSSTGEARAPSRRRP